MRISQIGSEKFQKTENFLYNMTKFDQLLLGKKQIYKTRTKNSHVRVVF